MIEIVGKGRIGGMVAALARAAGVEHRLLGRGEPLGEGPGPVLVATRNDDLEAVLSMVPAARGADLVFVQNGVLAPWLRARGWGQGTIGVLYVAVDAPGAAPRPGGVSVFCGPQAGAVARLLDGGGVPARAVGVEELRAEVGVKLAWICVLGVLGQATGLRAGEVAEAHEDALRALCEELRPVLVDDPDTAAPADLVERVGAYARAVGHYRTTLKEWPWRTGWLLQAAARQGRRLPLHEEWLRRAGVPPPFSA